MANEKAKKQNTVRQQTTGKVEVRRLVGHGVDGKAIRKSFYAETRRKALAKYDDYMLDQHKQDVESSDVSFGAWAERWLDTYKDGSVRGVTLDKTYKPTLRKHILPYFGKARLVDVKQVNVRAFLKSKAGYSASMYSKLRLILNQIFNAALGNGMILVNPLKGIPFGQNANAPVRAYRHAYSKDQARVVLDYSRTVPNGLGALLMLKTGMRRGEVLALRWDNVDMEHQIIHVKQSLSETDAGTETHDCKTKKSIRDIPFDDELLEVLSCIKRNGDYVLSGSSGRYIAPHNWSIKHYNVFAQNLAKAYPDLPILSPHELRHTFGSLLYSAGVDIVTISKLMGHASIDITVRLYVHDDMEMKRDAINALK